MKAQQTLFDTNNLGGSALFSDDRKYRFVLWRIWNNQLPKVMFIGLNPSTANEDSNDPTIRRVISFAKSWGYGGVYMLNLFTYVSAYPEQLKTDNNPLYMADEYLTRYAESVHMIIFAWGNFPIAESRGRYISGMLNGYCLGKNKNGSPKHPLYISSDIKPIKF
jgi:hypothetical protein